MILDHRVSGGILARGHRSLEVGGHQVFLSRWEPSGENIWHFLLITLEDSQTRGHRPLDGVVARLLSMLHQLEGLDLLWIQRTHSHIVHLVGDFRLNGLRSGLTGRSLSHFLAQLCRFQLVQLLLLIGGTKHRRLLTLLLYVDSKPLCSLVVLSAAVGMAIFRFILLLVELGHA